MVRKAKFTDFIPMQVELREAKARIAALEAQLAERVRVKTLEWTRGWMNAEAQTEIGQYTITYRRDGSFEWGIGILKGWASSWDEAKAAAQADFDRRILSALEATTPAPKVTESPLVTVQRGYDEWAAKPHNKKWVKRLDGTPIPNDLIVCIVTALTVAQEAGKP